MGGWGSKESHDTVIVANQPDVQSVQLNDKTHVYLVILIAIAGLHLIIEITRACHKLLKKRYGVSAVPV